MKKISWKTTKYVLLAIAIVWAAFPIFYIIIRSFTPASEIFKYPPGFPSVFSLENYMRLFTEWPQFWGSLLNSFIITFFTIILTLGVSIPASYALSRYKSRSLDLFTLFLVVVRMLPPIVITIPLFPLIKSFNMTDTHILMVVLYSAFMVSLVTLVIRTFIDQVPTELEEAAMIDGCNRFQALIKVVLPLLRPSFTATAVIIAVFSWNEFLFALIFTSTNAKTAPLMISEMTGSFLGVDWGILFAGATIQFIPILLFVWLVQNYLVEGLTLGAVKG